MPYFSCIVLPLWQRIPLTMEEVQRVQGKRKAWNKIPSQVPQCRIPLQLVFMSPGVLTPVPQRPVLPSHALLDQESSKKNLSVYVLLYFTQCISSFTSSLKLSPHLHSNLHSLRSINVPGKIFNCLLFCPQTHHPAQWPNWNFQPQSSTFPFLLPFFTGPITFQTILELLCAAQKVLQWLPLAHVLTSPPSHSTLGAQMLPGGSLTVSSLYFLHTIPSSW